MSKVVTRRITPAGFLLALLLFLFLPALAASCDAQPGNGKPVSLSYSGANLATGGHKVSGDTGLGPEVTAQVESGFRLSGAVPVLAIVTAIALALGLVTALLRTPRARALAAVVMAAAGAALLAVTEVQAVGKLTEVTRKITATFSELTQPPLENPDKLGADAVHVQYGFWLSAGLLLVVLALNVLVVFRHGRRGVTSPDS